jgi:His/Glu/Gln/Arg/opine family amino acid ABC transporter permease subunit
MKYEFDWSVLYTHRQLLLDGLLATIEVAGIAILLSSLIGTAVGVLRHFSPQPIKSLFIAYTEFFRNVPPIVQFFFWYFAVGLGSFDGAILGLSAFQSAYIAEVVRSGIQAIPRTQIEAARASGLSTAQMIRYVILPQATIRIVPALSIEFINVIKNSSIAMTIGVMELTFQTQEIEARTFRGFEAATAVTLLYVMLAFFVVIAMRCCERVLRIDVRGG